MTYGSLFTGVGGLDLGLDRAGLECRWQVENDPYAIRVLEKHWPTVKRYGDITQLSGDELEPVDLICGGFPCQDLSQAGKQAGIEGARSGLWFEYARLVRRLRPRYVLIENVAGLLVSDAMRRVVGELARLGYVGCWRSLRASEFRASHLRKRVFIVAYRDRRGFLGAIDGPERTTGDGEAQSAENKPDLEYPHCGGREGRRAGGSEALCGRRGDDVRHAPAESGGDVAYRESGGLGELREPSGCNGFTDGSHVQLGYTHNPRLEGRRVVTGEYAGQCATGPRGIGLEFAPGPSDPRWPAILRERPDLAPALESPLRGVASRLPSDLDGAMSHRTKRLGRLGNAVVPQIAEWLGRRILEFDEAQQ